MDLLGNYFQQAKESEIYIGETTEEYEQRIKEEGRFIWKPKENELFIDLDSKEDYERFLIAYSILEREYTDVEKETWPSKSGLPKRHILVTLPFNVDNITRVAYQAALGSDSKRELISIFRIENNDPTPTVFAEDKKRLDN